MPMTNVIIRDSAIQDALDDQERAESYRLAREDRLQELPAPILAKLVASDKVERQEIADSEAEGAMIKAQAKDMLLKMAHFLLDDEDTFAKALKEMPKDMLAAYNACCKFVRVYNKLTMLDND